MFGTHPARTLEHGSHLYTRDVAMPEVPEAVGHFGFIEGVHGVGGLIGTIMLGVFASTAINPNGADGLLYGGTSFFGKQVVAVLFSSVWAFVFTWVMLTLINKITTVKSSLKDEELGLDLSEHGEEAYEVAI